LTHQDQLFLIRQHPAALDLTDAYSFRSRSNFGSTTNALFATGAEVRDEGEANDCKQKWVFLQDLAEIGRRFSRQSISLGETRFSGDFSIDIT
jgi:hypothetical protein